MKLTIKRTTLAKLLSTASQAILSGGTLPVYQNVLLSAAGKSLEVSGFNLDYSIQIKSDAVVTQEGKTTVSAKRLATIISNMPHDAINIEINKNFGISVSAGKSQYHINGLDPAELQYLKLPVEAEAFSVNQDVLGTALESVKYATCKDTARYALMGTLLELNGDRLRCATADGRRLAIHSNEKITKKGSAIRFTVPARVADSLAGILSGSKPVAVQCGENKAVFSTDSVTIVTKLIEAPFPEIANIMPKSFSSSATVKRKELSEAVRRASQVASEAHYHVKVVLAKKAAMILAKSPEHGDAQEELPCKLAGSGVEFFVNPDYFCQALDASKSENCEISFNDGRSPIRVSDDAGNSCVIAPMNE